MAKKTAAPTVTVRTAAADRRRAAGRTKNPTARKAAAEAAAK